MFTTMSLQLPTHILLELVDQLKRRGGTQDLSEAITGAVQFWLADQKKQPKTGDPNGLHGYQWKCLFLPEGTVLRSWSYGEHNYACVEGDHIIHQGKEVSPNQFARSFARTNRNAWDDLFIRRPGDKQFKLACVLRKEILREQEALARIPAQPIAITATTAVPIVPERLPVEPAPLTVLSSTPPIEQRDTSQREDWTLPERRKWRIRLEDIAFD
ncbi:hypothetical protein ACXZ1M_26500 [Duganella sp. PWIR1]